MKLTIHIRDWQTGEVVVYSDDDACEWDETSDYLWADGNFACDCNRSLFFIAAKNGGEWPDDQVCERPCGDTRYVVEKIVNPVTGDILYHDNFL